MKKYFLLASFVAVILMINQVSFAADEVVAEAAEPCSCCFCTATAQAMPMPFAYPPAPQKMFGAKLQGLLSQCPLKHRAPAAYPYGPGAPYAAPAPAGLACDPCAAPAFPEPRPFRAAFAARRAARSAQPPYAYPAAPMMPAPMMESAPVAVPPVAVPSVGYTPAEMPAGFSATVGQTGRMNYMNQRASSPVINFLSVVRSPRAQYDPYTGGGFYQVPVAPQQPAQTPAQ